MILAVMKNNLLLPNFIIDIKMYRVDEELC